MAGKKFKNGDECLLSSKAPKYVKDEAKRLGVGDFKIKQYSYSSYGSSYSVLGINDKGKTVKVWDGMYPSYLDQIQPKSSREKIEKLIQKQEQIIKNAQTSIDEARNNLTMMDELGVDFIDPKAMKVANALVELDAVPLKDAYNKAVELNRLIEV